MAITAERLPAPGGAPRNRRPALATVGAVRRLPGWVNWAGLAAIVVVLIAWQLLVNVGVIDGEAMPSPTEIVSGLGTAISTGVFWPAVGHTVGVIVITWLIAVLIGGAAGLAIGLSSALYSWTTATVDVLRSLPTIAFFPMAILLWGASTKAEILISVYAAVWPVLVGTSGSVRTVNARLFDVAHTFKFSRSKTFFKIILPATGAATIVSARVALGITVVACITMEMVGTPLGVGFEVLYYERADNIAPMWAFILITGILGLLLNAAFMLVVRAALPGISLWSSRGRR